MDEAQLGDSGAGLGPTGEGWFVVNVREAHWLNSENDGGDKRSSGADCIFETPMARFPQFGIKLHVLEPGEPNGLYHAENQQEDFLVLSGECRLLVEGGERILRAWDFFHAPAGTEHIFRGRRRGAVRDPDGRWTVGALGGALPGVGARGDATAQVRRRRHPTRTKRTWGSSRRGVSGPLVIGTACPGRERSGLLVRLVAVVEEDGVAVRVADTGPWQTPESHISLTSTPASSSFAFASATSGTRNASVPGGNGVNS